MRHKTSKNLRNSKKSKKNLKIEIIWKKQIFEFLNVFTLRRSLKGYQNDDFLVRNHPQIAAVQACLTSEFYLNELPCATKVLTNINIISIFLSLVCVYVCVVCVWYVYMSVCVGVSLHFKNKNFKFLYFF
jgi:hypothetical protein